MVTFFMVTILYKAETRCFLLEGESPLEPAWGLCHNGSTGVSPSRIHVYAGKNSGVTKKHFVDHTSSLHFVDHT